ncbi:MAG: CbiQ family ECF transporter T component [Methylophilaceae bacterium]
MFKINTMTQLVALIVFALILNMCSLNTLLLMLVTFLFLLTYQKNNHFYRLMKRLKWFYLVMFIIFVFNTPGEHMVSWSYSVKPTYEGLQVGLKQLLRITLMLAVLSLILAHNTTQQLISGIYFMMKPLASIGIDVKRFAARLWLTLHYVEMQQANIKRQPSITNGLAERLNEAFVGNVEDYVEVTLEKTKQTWLDYVIILIMFSLLIIALVRPSL